MMAKKKDDLQEKLEAAQQQQDDKGISDDFSDDKQYQELEAKILQLEQEKKEFEEIAKRSQYEYINLKMDFDRYQRQMQESSKGMKLDSLFAVVTKFLPFLEDLRKSLESIPSEHKADPLAKGVQIVYNKFIATLEGLHIKVIETIGKDPDSFLHEPISLEATEEKSLKGKIVKEFERGFFYEKDGEKKVIKAAKVIVGQ